MIGGVRRGNGVNVFLVGGQPGGEVAKGRGHKPVVPVGIRFGAIGEDAHVAFGLRGRSPARPAPLRRRSRPGQQHSDGDPVGLGVQAGGGKRTSLSRQDRSRLSHGRIRWVCSSAMSSRSADRGSRRPGWPGGRAGSRWAKLAAPGGRARQLFALGSPPAPGGPVSRVSVRCSPCHSASDQRPTHAPHRWRNPGRL